MSAPGLHDADLLERAARRLKDFADELPARQRAAPVELLEPAPPAERAAADVLDPAEADVFAQLQAEPPPRAEVGPSLVMIMKATRLCNMRCAYCNQWRDGPNQNMRFPVLARAVRDALRAPGVRRVEFVWHGGETTLLPLRFYRKALWLQEQFRRPGQTVHNAVQTNGLRLTDEWIAFFRDSNFTVGISLDGPPEVHDQRRVDVAGRPTSARVRAGLDRLAAERIRHGVLLVVDDTIVDLGAERLLSYLLSLGVKRIDLLNALPKNTAPGAPLEGYYIEFERYVEFLRDVFRVWWPHLAERISIRELDGLVQQVRGGPPGTCVFAGNCFGRFLTIEPSGTVSACDKYVGDGQFVFGNLMHDRLADILSARRLESIRSANARAVDVMSGCRWFALCHGGCPHDRYTALRHQAGAGERCCGFAPLLTDIEEAVM
jgi:uncharacterized protein